MSKFHKMGIFLVYIIIRDSILNIFGLYTKQDSCGRHLALFNIFHHLPTL